MKTYHNLIKCKLDSYCSLYKRITNSAFGKKCKWVNPVNTKQVYWFT